MLSPCPADRQSRNHTNSLLIGLCLLREGGEALFLPFYTPAMTRFEPYVFRPPSGPPALKFRTFLDLAEKLKMDDHDLMRQCNGHATPSRAPVKGLAKELKIDLQFMEKLANKVRRDMGAR